MPKVSASEQQEAVQFLNSMRGQYIMAQALAVAVKELSKVPSPHTEISNIEDMKYLRRTLYTFPVMELKGRVI